MAPGSGDAAAEHIEAEELPPVITVEQALDPASPLVQRPESRPNDANARPTFFASGRSGGERRPNARNLVLEREYRFPMVTHFAIEPHAFAAAPTRAA
jgi:CO/xanthine dehydrogenase Mo-binding subunit